MQIKHGYASVAGIAAVAVPLALGLASHSSQAADHLDPPTRVDPDPSPGHAGAAADRAADLADLYAWYGGTGATQTFTTILSFDGPDVPVAGQHVPCDRDVLYSICIDNTGDAVAEYTITVNFGQDDTPSHTCFVSVAGLPGSPHEVFARVEAVTAIPGGGSLFVGLRDDAFFFDLQGFRDSLSNGRLINSATGSPYIHSDRDYFAGKNTPAIVIEFPVSRIRGDGTHPLRIWATTDRHPAT